MSDKKPGPHSMFGRYVPYSPGDESGRSELQKADDRAGWDHAVNGIRRNYTREHSPAELEQRTAAAWERANADKTTPEVFTKAKSGLEERLKRARSAPPQSRTNEQERER